MNESLARLERQRAFWKRENHDRPVIGFTGSYFSTDTVRLIGREQGRVTPDDIVVERIVDDAGRQIEAWQGCTGDLFGTATPLYQFRWLAAAVGAAVLAGGDSVWVEPFVRDYRQLEEIELDDDNPWLQKLWQLTDALVEQAAGRYPVAANEFMSPLSAVVDMRGNTEFALDLYDRPAEVKQALAWLTEVWCGLVCRQYQRIPAWNGGFTGAQRWIWAPGPIMEFSEDPAFMLSPRFHREVVLPAHRQVLGLAAGGQVPYPYLHLHSTQLHTLDHLLALDELPAIELTPDHGQSIADLIPVMARILARKPLIVHAFLTAVEMRLIVDSLPPEGLCIIGRAQGPDEACRLQEAVLR